MCAEGTTASLPLIPYSVGRRGRQYRQLIILCLLLTHNQSMIASPERYSNPTHQEKKLNSVHFLDTISMLSYIPIGSIYPSMADWIILQYVCRDFGTPSSWSNVVRRDGCGPSCLQKCLLSDYSLTSRNDNIVLHSGRRGILSKA